MRRQRHHLASYLIVLVLCVGLGPTAMLKAQEAPTGLKIKPGLGMEYFTRTIQWDEKAHSSKLKSLLLSFNTEFQVSTGFSINLRAGYAFSNFNGLIFRELPFSIDYEAGNTGGLFLGGEINKTLITSHKIEIAVQAQFTASIGLKQEWEIPDLNVEGKVEGSPLWMRASAGPVFFYRGLDYLYPYLSFQFNYLWGTFTMDQKVQSLTGKEEKKISGKGLFGISFGAVYEASNNIIFKGEAHVVPFGGGVDTGISGMILFAF